MTLNQSEVQRLLYYDANTGAFTWRVKPCRRIRVGQPAGATNTAGYIVIGISGKLYYAHRIAWFYMTGEWPRQVDHRDGDRSNNAWANLRLATHQQNILNAKLAKNSTSGFKGVSWHRAAGKWSAQIYLNGESKHLGLFTTAEDAHAAYVSALSDVEPDFVREA